MSYHNERRRDRGLHIDDPSPPGAVSYVATGAVDGSTGFSAPKTSAPSSPTAFTSMVLSRARAPVTFVRPPSGPGGAGVAPGAPQPTTTVFRRPVFTATPVRFTATERPPVSAPIVQFQATPGRPSILTQPPPAGRSGNFLTAPPAPVTQPPLVADIPPSLQVPESVPTATPSAFTGGGGSSVAFPGGLTEAEFAEAELESVDPRGGGLVSRSPVVFQPKPAKKTLSTGVIIGIAAGGALLVYLLTR